MIALRRAGHRIGGLGLRYLPFVALAALAAGSAWVARVLEGGGAGEVAGLHHEPDFYLERFETTTLDEHGRPRRRVAAEYMAHFPDSGTKELASPRMELYRQDGAPWRVEAERGWISTDDDVMLLLGTVRIWRDGADGQPEIDIHTRDLRVLPATEYGETDQPVVIATAASESRGVGMRAYLRQSRLELLSKVRTRYEKKPR